MDQAVRERIWVELADLFLDTELSAEQLARIAGVVRESGCSRDELRHIFRYELAPALGSNALSVAGEWAGFDPAEVIERARACQQRISLPCRIGILLGMFTFAARRDFERVEGLAFGGGSAR